MGRALNPPVRELTDERPDEIWVIQINPKERESEPRTVTQMDGRNELSGNLSLHQELDFIERIDQMLEDGHLVRDGKYKQIVVRVIELSRSRFSRFLGTASKLNRDPHFIRDLMSHGEARAEEFLTALGFEDAWKSRDPAAVMGYFAEDAEILSSAPFSNRGIHKGTSEVAQASWQITWRETSASTRRGSRSHATGSRGRSRRRRTPVPPADRRA